MSSMGVVGPARQAEQTEQAERPSVIRRAYDALVCWWVLLRARVLRTGQFDSEVEHCLQFQKGTRFQIRRGEVQFVDSESRRAEATASSFSSGRLGNDE